MSFSVIKTFQNAVSTLANRLLAPKTMQITERGIHQFCSPMQNMFNYIHIPINNLLAPTSLLINQVRGMKMKGQLQLRCKGCYKVARDGRLYIMCRLKPRHKQMQMQKSFKKGEY